METCGPVGAPGAATWRHVTLSARPWAITWRRVTLGRAVAGPPAARENDDVPLPSDSLHYLYGPLLALLVIAALGVLMRWTFGTHREHRAPERDPNGDYGLLTEVAVVPSPDAASVLRRRLAADGIRATLTPTVDGQGRRIMVFPDDERTARLVLARRD